MELSTGKQLCMLMIRLLFQGHLAGWLCGNKYQHTFPCTLWNAFTDSKPFDSSRCERLPSVREDCLGSSTAGSM